MPATLSGRFPDFARLPRLFNEGRVLAGRRAGQALVRQFKAGIRSGPKSGRIYNGKPAGAPGEYSQNRSGALLNSGDYEVRNADQFDFGARNSAPHAVFQENGTRKMEARPNLGNASRDAQGQVTQILGQTVYDKIKRA